MPFKGISYLQLAKWKFGFSLLWSLKMNQSPYMVFIQSDIYVGWLTSVLSDSFTQMNNTQAIQLAT